MANLLRGKVNWTGFPGSPGYTVFHANPFQVEWTDGATALRNAMNNFMVAISNNLPNNVTVTPDPEVELIESTTGELINTFTTATLAGTTGTGGVAYSGPTGAVVNWRTATIRRGRRMRGRTFLVPLANACYENDGSLTAIARDDIAAAAATFIADVNTELVVYGRPTPATAANPNPAPDGVVGVVTSSSVPDMAAVLRSRRG